MAEDFQEQVHSPQGFEIRKKRENVFMISIQRMSKILFATKQLFVGSSICRSRDGLSANEKEGKNTSNDNKKYLDNNSPFGFASWAIDP